MNLTPGSKISAHPGLKIFYSIYVIHLSLGINILSGKYKISNGAYLTTSNGSNAGLEGARSMNPYFGIGGRFSVASMPVLLNKITLNEPLVIFSGSAGTYFSYLISTRWSAGSKRLAGYTHFSKCTFLLL